MTSEQINIAIAEDLGWEFTVSHDGADGNAVPDRWDHEDGRRIWDVDYPANFYSSLDACVEFEKTLTTLEERDSYVRYLYVLADKCDPFEATALFHQFDIVSATAPQRCEAYLRVKGLWKEGEV